MTHTSTEQPEALMKLADDYAEACFDQGLHQRTTDDKPEAAREKLEKELRRLHARMQELEAIRKAACKAHNTWAYADDTYGEVTKAMHALADAINGITQEKP